MRTEAYSISILGIAMGLYAIFSLMGVAQVNRDLSALTNERDRVVNPFHLFVGSESRKG